MLLAALDGVRGRIDEHQVATTLICSQSGIDVVGADLRSQCRATADERCAYKPLMSGSSGHSSGARGKPLRNIVEPARNKQDASCVFSL